MVGGGATRGGVATCGGGATHGDGGGVHAQLKSTPLAPKKYNIHNSLGLKIPKMVSHQSQINVYKLRAM